MHKPEGIPQEQVVKMKEMNTEGLIGIIDVSKLSIPSLDEGIFPEEILEIIDRRRERIMERITKVVEKKDRGEIEKEETREKHVDEIRKTIQVIILEIEKLQVQTGTKCVEECNKIVQELEHIRSKLLEKEKTNIFRSRWFSLILISLSLIIYKIIKRDPTYLE